MKKFITFCVVALMFSSLSCKNPVAKQIKANDNAAKTQNELVEKTTEIEDKGKAFVYGSRYSLDHLSTSNRTVETEVAHRFADLAQLTLGNPSLADAQTIQEIANDLLAKADAETALAKKERDQALKKVQEGEKKLSDFVGQIKALNEEKGELQEQYKKDIDSIKKVANSNAEDAQKYKQEHTFWRSINPFYDLGQFFKKLMGWGIFLGVLVLGFSILEIVCPEMKIFGVLFGWVASFFAKIFPSMKSAAGFVSSKVYDGFKQVVVGYQHAVDVLKNHPIEDEILKNFPDDKEFSKTEVKTLLEQHTEQILDILKKEQDEHQDDNTRGVVQQAKSETGLKPVASSPVV